MSTLDEPRVLTDKYVADQIMIHLAMGNSGSISCRALVALQRLRELHRWRPIAELHEDFGDVIVINVNDGEYNAELAHVCNRGFDASLWTHFSRITPLSTEQVESMRAGLPAAAEV